MYSVGDQNIPLCLDCYFKTFQIQQAQLENAERQMNFWSDMMDYQIGFPPSGPRFPQRKAIHVGDVTLNNIKVDNSTVGSINTGTVGSLDIAITSIKQIDAKAADALTQLSQAVLNNQTLSQEAKNETIEILSALAAEAAAPQDRKRISLAKTLLNRLKELIEVSTDLGALWTQWGPILTGIFGG